MNKEKFDKFCELLEGKEGCNFREDKKGKKSTQTWDCHHDHRFAKKILKEHFKDVDEKKFLEFCTENGGYCDCEILFNVEVKE